MASLDIFKQCSESGDNNCNHHSFHPSTIQKYLIASVGEFVVTFFFLWFAYAGSMQYKKQVTLSPSGESSDTTVFFIAHVYSFSLLANVWAFYRISGGLFNPAVTLGLCLAGTLRWARAAFLVPAQIIASMCAGGLARCMFPGDLAAANTVLSSDTSIVQGLFIEIFFTAFLMFVVLMLAAERSKDTFIAPIGIGLALFVAVLGGTSYTGASLNPVRSFGCAVATLSFPGYEWISSLGPFMGASMAAGFYHFVKSSHYEKKQIPPGRRRTTHGLLKVITATNRVLVGNGDYDQDILTWGTMSAIRNTTWNGKLGFQSEPTTPNDINLPDLQQFT